MRSRGVHDKVCQGNSPPGLAITGTAFWARARRSTGYDFPNGNFDPAGVDDKTICFGLKNFLAVPFTPGTYKYGHEGEGFFVKPPRDYHLGDNDLRWVIDN